MATQPTTRSSMTLEEFLRWPRIQEMPYLEYIEAKVSPQRQHLAIEGGLYLALNQFARPSRLGLAWLELRCTFAGRWSEIFGWLRYRPQGSSQPGADPR